MGGCEAVGQETSEGGLEGRVRCQGAGVDPGAQSVRIDVRTSWTSPRDRRRGVRKPRQRKGGLSTVMGTMT